MSTKYNSDLAKNSVDAVVLAGKSKLIVKDKLNIIYFSSPLSSSYPFASYYIEDVSPQESINKENPDYKAIIKIGGKPMVNYVMKALAESDYINSIYIVGVKDKLNKINFSRSKEKIKFVDDKGSFIDNLIEGGNKAKSDKILFSTSDIPLIKKEHINDFIENCFERDTGSVYISYYTKESNNYNLKANYPARIEGKHLRNGGIFMMNRAFLDEISKKGELYEAISPLYGKRKKGLWPYLKLVKIYIPTNVLIRYIFNNLTIKYAEKAISNKLTNRINKKTGNNLIYNLYAIESVPEFGIDVDSYKDLKNIKKIIKKEQNLH